LTVIVIGGTPGTGKTEVARVLGSLLSVEVFSLGQLADDAGCVKAIDKARNTGVVDEDCLVDAIISLLEKKKGRLIIEGHYIDLIPSKEVEHAFILRTHPQVLRERLKQRGYSEAKVAENVEAEVIGVCQMDALDAFDEEIVSEIDTTSLSPRETANKIVEILNSGGDQNRIDWMEMLEQEGRLDDFLRE